MSSNNNEFEVKMVRIQQLDNSNTITYDDNVRISILFDTIRQSICLYIMTNGKNVYTQKLNDLKWLSESSTNGVATIRSSTATIVIIYNKNNESLLHLFDNLQASLEHETRTTLSHSISSQSNQGQLETMIDDLLRSITTGSLNNAECITRQLAKSQVDVQFNLLNKNDNQDMKITQSKSNDTIVESSDSIIQLTLHIECSTKDDPIIAPITVRSGTTLQSLKQQIEKETGINCANQYWFAFDRYPISNEYVFGSSVSIVSNQNQQRSPINPIRSGDTLIITGCAAHIKIKNDRNPNDIRSYANVKLRLTTDQSDPQLFLQVPPDNEIIGQYRLKNCSYVSDSSSPGSVECIRKNSEDETLIIIDTTKQCTELLKHMRNYLTQHTTTDMDIDPPEPIPNENVNRLIQALNNSNGDEAARIARQLASQKIPIRFALDMINEYGNAPPREPPKPPVKPLQLKLTIESFLIDSCTDEQFDVAILPETTIKDLKQIVTRDTQVPSQQQYWFINRDHLDDNYKFGDSHPRANENTVLTLYIAKTQNH
ncbi:unnamed protein product [Rotaria sordida]|uniref:Ubiquitin-like domain-containing protein n=1 Tax=Rotaria sordida TaxID=392033 RepID=A0A818MGQ7_9BILA|nr:unnamed protein product [Rotaria sordida]